MYFNHFKNYFSFFFLLIFFQHQINFAQNVANTQNSLVEVPISMKVSDIENALNAKYTDVVFEDNNFDSGGYGVFAIKVQKLENFKITGKESTNILESYAVLKSHIKGVAKIDFFGMTLDKNIDQFISLKVWLASKLEVLPHWEAKTQTDLVKYEWIDEPVLDFGLLQLPMADIANSMIRSQKKEFLQKFDDQLAKYIDIKKPISDAWNIFQQPQMISEWEGDKVYLQMQGQKIGLTPLVFIQNKLNTGVQVQCNAQGSVRQKTNFLPNPLPNYNPIEKIGNFTQISAIGKVERTLVIEKCKKIFGTQEFTYKKYSAKIKDINLTPHPQKKDVWVITLDMLGSVNGKVIVEGIPVYDPKDKQIEIKKLQYRIEGDSDFPKFAEWLFKSKIKNQIRKAIEEPLNAQVAQVKAEIAKSLAKYPLEDENKKNIGEIQGILEEFYVSDFGLDNDFMTAKITAKAKASVIMNGELGIKN